MKNKKKKDLMFYEIYPTSFQDSNHDGVGDLKGITKRLDYIAELGFNGIWLNPFYVSPFLDGGYDVADFFDVDPRFGTLQDFDDLIKKAHELGISVIVDLVAGHASCQNPDFLESAKWERNKKSDLFIWNSSVWDYEPNYRLIGGMYPRHGNYMVNFFAHQPAFNYGFAKVEYPSWQMSYKDERTMLARNYLLDVMRFWLKRGADGFRVDMADSLVKNDEDKSATIEVWQYLFKEIRAEYPDAFFVSEWSYPERAFEAGFDADFVLDHWDNFYHRLTRSNENTRGTSYFHHGEQGEFILKDLLERYAAANKYHKALALISGNHDTTRIANYLNHEELKLFYLMLFTLPGIPFVLYGDEIEMKTSAIPSRDGGYQRTGTRIPMIWDNSVPYHDFSDTKGETYLPFYEKNTISVESAWNDPDSLLHWIKELTALRSSLDDLKEEAIEIRKEGDVWRFDRGAYELVVNFSNDTRTLENEAVITTSMKENCLTPVSGALCKKG